jgi:transposase
MSMRPRLVVEIPEETVIVAQAAFPNGNVYMQLRDEWEGIYTDEQFADLYPADGQPSIAPWRLALVTVMQFMENLSEVYDDVPFDKQRKQCGTGLHGNMP